MFENLIVKFAMDYLSKVVLSLATAGMAAGYITADQSTAIVSGVLAALAAAITAGFKIANTKAAAILPKTFPPKK